MVAYGNRTSAKFEPSPLSQVACYHHNPSLTGGEGAFAIINISQNNYKACENAFSAVNGGTSHDDHDCVFTYELVEDEEQ